MDGAGHAASGALSVVHHVRMAAVGPVAAIVAVMCSFVVAALMAIAAGMLGLSSHVCTAHCQGQCCGNDADRKVCHSKYGACHPGQCGKSPRYSKIMLDIWVLCVLLVSC